jgi:hypothetical protein
MELVSAIVDFGNAQELHVDGIARVERISRNVVRVSYYTRHKAADGRVENRLVLHLDWDIDNWGKNCALFRQLVADFHNESRMVGDLTH